MVGIARFVLHNKEHLAALIPAGPALMLGTLRWANEIRSPDGLDLPKAGEANSLKPTELKMAQQLIAEMTSDFKPQGFKDDFTSAIRALISKKAEAGDKATVQPFEDAPDTSASNVVDLTALLRRSLGGGRKDSKPSVPAEKTAPRSPKQGRKTAAKTQPRKKAA